MHISKNSLDKFVADFSSFFPRVYTLDERYSSSLAFCDHSSSFKQTFCRLPAFEPGFDKNKSCQLMPAYEHGHYFSLGPKPAAVIWRRANKKERNVPLASADIRRGGRLRDEPKECLRRRLRRDPISPLCPSEESTRMDSPHGVFPQIPKNLQIKFL